MKTILKLFMAVVLFGLLVSVVSADEMSGAATEKFVPAAVNLPKVDVPNSAGITVPAGAAADYLTHGALVAYIRRAGGSISKIYPTCGSNIPLTTSEIIRLGHQGKYTGPAGTYAMMDLYNIAGTWPMNGIARVDEAVTMSPGVTTTQWSPPYWFDFDHVGVYGFNWELWGGGQSKFCTFTITVA